MALVPPPVPPPLPAKARTTTSFKTTITPQHIVTAVQALEMGLPLANVAGLLGITRQTLARWRELGSREDCTDPLLVDFVVKTDEARAKACLKAVGVMQMHALTDWRAAHELLKAADPETWAPKSSMKIDATLAPKEPELDFSGFSDEEFRAYQALQAKAQAAKALASGD